VLDRIKKVLNKVGWEEEGLTREKIFTAEAPISAGVTEKRVSYLENWVRLRLQERIKL
jgi:hypothetical protein